MTKVVHLYASQRVSRRAKDGRDGTSVTIISKSVTYQISASGTETPTGNWSDKVVATTDTKPYLWTRTIVVYSDTNSTTSYSVSYKGKDGAPGKDAYRVEVSPSTLVFDTNENGVVDGSALSGKYATVTVYKGSQKISVDNLSLPSNYATKKYTNVDGKISNNNGEARITITKIEQEAISGDEKVSKSSGQISFPIDVLGERSTLMWVTVNVQVNVAKFTGSVVANNKKFETKFTEISNRFKNTPTNKDLTDAESRITQTAREISLSVSEKVIGRRNLLIGSAARRQGEGWTFMSGDYYNGLPCDSIEINSGYDGVNAIHCRTKQTGTNSYYMCGFRWIGTYSSQGNIKIEKGKSYTLSFWAKAYNSGYVNFVSELIWEGSATDNSRPAGYAGPKGFSTTQQATKNNTWTLFKVNIEVPSDSSYEYVEVNVFARATNYTLQDAFICKPMFEEGDYNGWTLSTEDYDYVGGNMLDNTRTLDKSGTLYEVTGRLTPAGFGESTSIYKSFVYKLKGTVDSFSQLPSSGNVYGDTYCVRNTEICYRYNGSEFESVGNDYYYNVLEWRKLESGAFVPFGLEANKDYVFSFMAKGTGKLTAYFYSPETNVFIESSLGETATRVDGTANFQLTSDWKKYWVHWRPSDSSHRYILLRLNRTIQSSAGDAPITNCYIAQPKLEAGAVVTEYTERKSDLVDKASLKAAGIEITSDQVKLYGDKVQVLTRKDGDTEYEEAGMFTNGKFNANLIDAINIVTQALQTGKINADKATIRNLSIIGSLRNPFTRVSESTDVDFNDNIAVITKNYLWEKNEYSLPWDNTQNGRRVTIMNLKWNTEIATTGADIKAPEGMYFFEDGLMKSKLHFSRECVELLGIGDDTKFFGWVVTNRTELSSLWCSGSTAKVLAYGSIEAKVVDNKLQLDVTQISFDGKKIKVTQENGGYKMKFPTSWGSAVNFVPVITPYKFIGYIYIYDIGEDYMIIKYSGKSSENRDWDDASFRFTIQSTNTFPNYNA